MIIVQAREGGTRLPGKVLKEINGKPLIGYLAERLDLTEMDWVVAWAHNYPEVDENDVAGRFRCVLKESRARWFVRVCADSPLLDPALINAACWLFRETGAKLVSNPGYPHGQQVEVIDTKWFLECEPKMADPRDREHVTACLYKTDPDDWITFSPGASYNTWPKLAVDTPEDFARMERIIGRMTRDHTEYNWLECVELARDA